MAAGHEFCELCGFFSIFENCYLTLTKIKCFCVDKAYMYSIFSLWLSGAHSNIRDPSCHFLQIQMYWRKNVTGKIDISAG